VTYASLGEIRTASAEAFVRTALLIDNEPDQEILSGSGDEEPLVAESGAYGAVEVAGVRSDKVTADDLRPAPATKEPLNSPAADDVILNAEKGHSLAVLPVTNAFAARKITCGFYFPVDDDEERLISTAFEAARNVDATIVDWQLLPGDAEPAKKLITKLIKDDREAGGRLRLIVVYTGERGLDAECTKLQAFLAEQGIDGLEPFDDGRALRSRDLLITFANKPQPGKPGLELEGPGARPKDWAELPAFVLEQYGFLAQGLLQAFALKSIGAVRDDTHHLLSVFAPELDAAYLAQRAGIGTPSDAEEMVTSILASEFVTSINDRKIPEEVLGADAAILALKVRDEPGMIPVKDYKAEPVYQEIVKTPPKAAKHILADKASLELLCRVGLDQVTLGMKSEARKDFDQNFFADAEEAQAVLSRFARLTSFSREASEVRRMGRDELLLTGGVIIRSAVGDQDQNRKQYLLCVQPGCDAVRLQGTVPFPFCRLQESTGTFDLILSADGAEKRLKVERKPRSIAMIEFAAHATKGIVVSEKEDGKFGFWSADRKTFWEFMAELRPLEAQHFISLLANKFNRVALNGSEWLRLHGSHDGD
jgi:hypothetical protein